MAYARDSDDTIIRRFLYASFILQPRAVQFVAKQQSHTQKRKDSFQSQVAKNLNNQANNSHFRLYCKFLPQINPQI